MGGNEVVDGGGNRLVDGHGKVQFTGWKFSMKCSSVAVASSTSSGSTASSGLWLMPRVQRMKIMAIGQSGRSEEHTSELQSLMRNSYAVFCLKKKKKKK